MKCGTCGKLFVCHPLNGNYPDCVNGHPEDLNYECLCEFCAYAKGDCVTIPYQKPIKDPKKSGVIESFRDDGK